MEIPNKFSSELALEIFRISTGRKRFIFLFLFFSFFFFFKKGFQFWRDFPLTPRKRWGTGSPGMTTALQETPPALCLGQLLCTPALGVGAVGLGRAGGQPALWRAHQDDDQPLWFCSFGFCCKHSVRTTPTECVASCRHVASR